METSTKYAQLTAPAKKQVDREVAEIKHSGQNAFWMDTGLHADKPENHWSVVKYAMGELVSPSGTGRAW